MVAKINNNQIDVKIKELENAGYTLYIKRIQKFDLNSLFEDQADCLTHCLKYNSSEDISIISTKCELSWAILYKFDNSKELKSCNDNISKINIDSITKYLNYITNKKYLLKASLNSWIAGDKVCIIIDNTYITVYYKNYHTTIPYSSISNINVINNTIQLRSIYKNFDTIYIPCF